MQHMGLRSLQLLIALVAIIPARAQNYPVKPIGAIVQAGAGARSNVIPWAVFDQLSARLGSRSLSKIAPGLATRTAAVAKSEPDGYAILAASRRLPTVLVTCPAEGQHNPGFDRDSKSQARLVDLTSTGGPIGDAFQCRAVSCQRQN
jgi:hypothetical protein